jgi:hypothetical protein
VSYNGQYCDFITIIGTTDEKKRHEGNDNDGEKVKAMTASEQVLWHNEVTEGFFKKKVVETQKITDYRVYQNSDYITLSELDDIMIMNAHNVSESNSTSMSSGTSFPTGFGSSKSRSKKIGDLVFIYRGTPRIIFKQIEDPQGVARLAKAARKRVIADMKATEKINKAQLQEQLQKQQQQNERISSISGRTGNNTVTTCARCAGTNAKGSRYCNNCGFRFADTSARIMNQRRSLSSVSSLQSSVPKTMEQNINQFVTCELPAYGIKIEYPCDWFKCEQSLNPPIVIGFRSPKEHPSDTFSESVAVALVDAPNMKLEQFTKANIRNLKNKRHDFLIVESVQTVMAGQDAQKIVYDANGKRIMIVVIMREGKVYEIIYIAEQTKYDNYLPIVQKMIDSFEITNKSYQ